RWAGGACPPTTTPTATSTCGAPTPTSTTSPTTPSWSPSTATSEQSARGGGVDVAPRDVPRRRGSPNPNEGRPADTPDAPSEQEESTDERQRRRSEARRGA